MTVDPDVCGSQVQLPAQSRGNSLSGQACVSAFLVHHLVGFRLGCFTRFLFVVPEKAPSQLNRVRIVRIRRRPKFGHEVIIANQGTSGHQRMKKAKRPPTRSFVWQNSGRTARCRPAESIIPTRRATSHDKSSARGGYSLKCLGGVKQNLRHVKAAFAMFAAYYNSRRRTRK